jgi:hypothetical protein
VVAPLPDMPLLVDDPVDEPLIPLLLPVPDMPLVPLVPLVLPVPDMPLLLPVPELPVDELDEGSVVDMPELELPVVPVPLVPVAPLVPLVPLVPVAPVAPVAPVPVLFDDVLGRASRPDEPVAALPVVPGPLLPPVGLPDVVVLGVPPVLDCACAVPKAATRAAAAAAMVRLCGSFFMRISCCRLKVRLLWFARCSAPRSECRCAIGLGTTKAAIGIPWAAGG